ncbi:helix-turn-helix transcriptional regulator [Lawsonibacter faecis]
MTSDPINMREENKKVRVMDTIQAVKNRILRLCEEHGLTINALATVSALPPSSVKNILYGKSQNPKLLTIKMICDGLGITLGEFFNTSEFNDLEQEVK